MNWGGVADFLAMGGDGLYVWGSFAMTAAAAAWEALMLAQRRHHAVEALRDQVAHQRLTQRR